MPRVLTIGLTAVVAIAAGSVLVVRNANQGENPSSEDAVYILDTSGQSATEPIPDHRAVIADTHTTPDPAVAGSFRVSPQPDKVPAENPRVPRAPDADGAATDTIVGNIARHSSTPSITLSGEIGGLVWNLPDPQPGSTAAYRGLSLRLQGPEGKILEKSSDGYSAIVLSNGLSDGRYSWETISTPEIDPYAREQLRASRESGDNDQYRRMVRTLQKDGFYPSRAELERNVSSGSFLVMNGQVVSTGTREN